MDNITNPILTGIAQRFGELQQNLARNQQDALAEAQNNSVETNRRYLNSIQNVQEEARKRMEEAFTTYIGALQVASLQQDPQKRSQDAYQMFTDLSQRIYQDAAKRYQDANNDYLSTLQNAQQAAKQQGLESYRAYLQSLKDSWAQLDVDAVVDVYAAASK